MDEQREHDETGWYLPGGPAVLTEERPGDGAPPSSGWQTPPQQPRRRGLPGALALLLAGALVGGGAYGFATRGSGSTTTRSGSTAPAISLPTAPSGSDGSGSSSGQGPASTGTGDSSALDVGVVDIVTTLGYQGGRAAGTGMVLTSDGEVLTNNHVISGATAISVTYVATGRTYRASVVGYDVAHDVAVITLQGASGLTPVTTSATGARTGDSVTAVGNAGGQGGTPAHASGTVTATGRTITATDESGGGSEQLSDLIETDAGIVAGDSGGPLYNSDGQVVGVDTAGSASGNGFRFSQVSGTSDGYAIPIADALAIVRQIDNGDDSGTVHLGATGLIGVTLADGNGQSGAVVQGVVDGGPAAKAGLSLGDTITAVDGTAVTSVNDLRSALLHSEPGQHVRIRYVDGSGSEQTTTVTLTEGPPQ